MRRRADPLPAPLSGRRLSLFFHWREAQVHRPKDAAPALLLSGAFKEVVEGREVSLSLSHSKTHAIAVVVITVE